MIAALRRRWRAIRLPRPSAAAWDEGFAAGRWDFLGGRAERARLALVAHYVRCAAPADAVILDLGCGEGLLLEQLRDLPFARYIGVDLSAVAVARAATRWAGEPRARFVAADASTYRAPEPPHVVVLNEMLYYLPDPEASVRAWLAEAAAGAALVVSIYDKGKTRPLWRMLARVLPTVEASTLSVAGGPRWRVAWLGATRP